MKLKGTHLKWNPPITSHPIPSQQHGEYVLCDESAVEALALLYEVFLLEEFLEREFFSVQNSLDRRLLREPRDAPERALNHEVLAAI